MREERRCRINIRFPMCVRVSRKKRGEKTHPLFSLPLGGGEEKSWNQEENRTWIGSTVHTDGQSEVSIELFWKMVAEYAKLVTPASPRSSEPKPSFPSHRSFSVCEVPDSKKIFFCPWGQKRRRLGFLPSGGKENGFASEGQGEN